MLSHSVVFDSATPWTVAHEASLPMGILQTRILEYAAIPYIFSSLIITHMYTHISGRTENLFFIVEVESFFRICVRIDSLGLICLFTQWGSFHSYIQFFFSIIAKLSWIIVLKGCFFFMD